MKKILIASIALLLVGCSQQTQAETNPTTIETTTVVETTVEESTTQAETSIASLGKYGEYGKEAYELLKFNWENWLYENEGELRENAPIVLGSISSENLEIIIQELLSIDRGQNPSQVTQSESLSETQTSKSQAEAPQSTQAVEPTKSIENKSTEPAPQQTQSEVQSTEPAPTQPVNTGDTGAVMSKEEEDAIWEEAGLGDDGYASENTSIQDGPLTWDPDADHNYNWQ